MSQRSAGSCTRCTRSNAFPAMTFEFITYFHQFRIPKCHFYIFNIWSYGFYDSRNTTKYLGETYLENILSKNLPRYFNTMFLFFQMWLFTILTLFCMCGLATSQSNYDKQAPSIVFDPEVIFLVGIFFKYVLKYLFRILPFSNEFIR